MDVFQRNDHHVYFLYGANLNPVQLSSRCGDPVRLGVARLADHRLAFFGRAPVWDGGYETIVPRPGGEVWGVLYRMTFSQAEQLDAWQDARTDGCGAYFLFPVKVVGPDDTSREALVYKKDRCGEPGLPSDAQMGFIVQSAHAQGLPAGYIASLKSEQTRKAGYAVPRRDGFEKRLLSLPCHGCG